MLTSNKDGQVTTQRYDLSLRITQTVLQSYCRHSGGYLKASERIAAVGAVINLT
jgi:hypothetical protein